MEEKYQVNDWKNISSEEREIFIRETSDGYMLCSAIKLKDQEYLGKFYFDLTKGNSLPRMIKEDTMELLKFKMDLYLTQRGLTDTLKRGNKNAST